MGTGVTIARRPTDRGESDAGGTGQTQRFDMYLFGFFHHVVHERFGVDCFSTVTLPRKQMSYQNENSLFFIWLTTRRAASEAHASLHDDINFWRISNPL